MVSKGLTGERLVRPVAKNYEEPAHSLALSIRRHEHLLVVQSQGSEKTGNPAQFGKRCIRLDRKARREIAQVA